MSDFEDTLDDLFRVVLVAKGFEVENDVESFRRLVSREENYLSLGFGGPAGIGAARRAKAILDVLAAVSNLLDVVESNPEFSKSLALRSTELARREVEAPEGEPELREEILDRMEALFAEYRETEAFRNALDEEIEKRRRYLDEREKELDDREHARRLGGVYERVDRGVYERFDRNGNLVERIDYSDRCGVSHCLDAASTVVDGVRVCDRHSRKIRNCEKRRDGHDWTAFPAEIDPGWERWERCTRCGLDRDVCSDCGGPLTPSENDDPYCEACARMEDSEGQFVRPPADVPPPSVEIRADGDPE